MGQKTNKYHVSDDGSIYKVNEDGTVTAMGNVKDINAPKRESDVSSSYKVGKKAPTKTTHIWIWALVFILILFGIKAIAILFSDSDYVNYANDHVVEYVTVDTVGEEVKTEITPISSNQYEESEEATKKAEHTPITFRNDRNYTNYTCSDVDGYYEVAFGSDGVTSIYYIMFLNHNHDKWTEHWLDNGSYELINGMISFQNFSNWPNGTVYFNDDDSFQLNGLIFRRGNM